MRNYIGLLGQDDDFADDAPRRSIAAKAIMPTAPKSTFAACSVKNIRSQRCPVSERNSLFGIIYRRQGTQMDNANVYIMS